MLAVDDSVEIAEHAASLGLLDAAQVQEVRRETHSDGAARLPWPMDVVRHRNRAGRAGDAGRAPL